MIETREVCRSQIDWNANPPTCEGRKVIMGIPLDEKWEPGQESERWLVKVERPR